MARTKFSELRDAVVAKHGAAERLARLRAETMEEIRLYELCHDEAISQVELVGRLDVTQGRSQKLENSEDVRVSTLRQYLEGLGAQLELVAVFEDEGRRVPVHLGRGSSDSVDLDPKSNIICTRMRTKLRTLRWFSRDSTGCHRSLRVRSTSIKAAGHGL